MKQNDLRSNIYLDTIAIKKHLYGIGPLDSLSGEITVINGTSYVSEVDADGSIVIRKTFKIGAPFFVYATMSSGTALKIPDSVSNIPSLERHLAKVYGERKEKPFPFTIRCRATVALIHIVNPGSTGGNDGGHEHKKVKFTLENRPVNIVGFYSEKHKGIFTHHDSNIHLHLITPDKTMMGHVDEITFVEALITIPAE
ncbi:MAG TPA: acetolactate decarboxylase [Chryseosolibacter sp.]|nr:acetolactate decarboxylase [Chryseosolibacter sp.]